MTREEARREIDSLDFYLQNHTDDYSEESHAAMMMAIKVLEQEPCEDAISRKKVMNQIFYSTDNSGDVVLGSILRKRIEELPPVMPTRKKGHWIEGQTDNPKIHNILCSCCFEGYPSKGHANSQYTKKKFQYCPNCSAEMGGEE